MWTCPNCKIEVDPGFEVCWACGTSRDGTLDPNFDPEFEGIMDEKAYEKELAARQQDSFVTIASFLSAAEAHVIQSRLEAEGIRAVVTEEQTSAWLLPRTNLGGAKVEVMERDAERARELLAVLREQARDNSSEGDEEE
jgi:hypothetical protein